MRLINFKSKPKLTPFAPEWNYFMFETNINNIDFKKFAKYLLKKEKEILNLPCTIKEDKISDGYTGLGKDSVSSRYDKYNIFFWKNKEVDILKNNILEFHNKFLEILKINPPKELYIQSWVNIMRKGEQIKPHIHNTESDTYLGGHICIQCKDTSTIYINPVNQLNDPETYVSKNEVGKLTLFQSCLPHYTDIHKTNEERVTIAFDLFLNKKCDNYLKIL